MRLSISGMAAIGLAALAVFCPRPAATQTNPYFPLEAGLHREYTSPTSSAAFIEVEGTKVFHGETVWVLRQDRSGADPRHYFYSIATDGDVLYHGDRLTNSSGEVIERVAVPAHRLLDMPVAQGQTWTDNYELHIYIDGALDAMVPGYSFSGETVATDSPVSVPAGDFTALEIAGVRTVPGQVQYLDNWFVAGNGIVRWDEAVQGSPFTSSWLLQGMPVDNEDTSWGELKALYR